MSFGLKNAGATLQRALNFLMIGLTWEEDLTYLDDLTVFAPTFIVFPKSLEKGFQFLQIANLWLKLNKSFFEDDKGNS